MTMIQLCTPQLDTSAEALLRRINALERKAIAPTAASSVSAENDGVAAQQVNRSCGEAVMLRYSKQRLLRQAVMLRHSK